MNNLDPVDIANKYEEYLQENHPYFSFSKIAREGRRVMDFLETLEKN